jgi:WXG100 family type VII secretion target
MANVIQTDYEQLAQIARVFEEQHATVTRQLKALQDAVNVLRNGGWEADAATAFFADMDGDVFPGIERLAQALVLAGDTTTQIAQTFKQAEQEGAGYFNASGDNSNPGFIGGIRDWLFGEDDDHHNVEGGTGNEFLSQYTRGDSWTYLNNKGFESGEELAQVGPSCTIYGIMNLLVQEGIDISQEDANAIYEQMKADYPDSGVTNGFPIAAAKDILDQYGVSYQHDTFKREIFGIDVGFAGNDQAAAREFLVEQISQGNSIYVTTEVDDSFGLGDGGHAYTVVGTQQDSNGELTNVLVSTNWGSSPYEVVPIDKFMDDWIGWANGEYIIVP